MNSPLNCRMCGSKRLTHPLHVPSFSKIALEIVQCLDCNLVQGICDESAYAIENDNFKDPSLFLSEISCDSPYSNIRVGKQQMASKFFDIFKTLPLDIKSIESVLDVRAARGSFLLKSPEYFKYASVFVGIEQDLYLHPPKNSYDVSAIKIFDYSVYELQGKSQSFDFVYSCHTLEHYRDPNRYIQAIKSLVSSKGYFFLDVPALKDFVDHDLLDDFFYDKHLLYFTESTLFKLLESNGFSILWSRSSGNGCIEILARLTDSFSGIRRPVEADPSKIKPSQISDYSRRLSSSRSTLPMISNHITEYITSSKGEFVAFGAGRILDAFKVYGNLNLAMFDHFIDNYLSEASNIVNSLQIKPLSELRQQENLKFILFTRGDSQSLHDLILSLHPSSKVLHWSSFRNTNNLSI